MKFQFPSNTKLESVNLRIKVTTGNKIRAIAKERDIPITEVYATIIEEAIEEYRQLFPEKTNEVAKKKVYSVKRDYLEAGDNLKKEVLKDEPFDGGGDLRTKETKNAAAVVLGRRGGLVGGNARAAKLSSEERSNIAKKAARDRWAKKKAQEIEVEKLPKEWWKKENLDSDGSYLYCANGNCKKYKFGKFLKGSETDRDGKVFCSIVCADEVSPMRQALPANFVYAYCQYLLCGKKKYISEDGIEAGGKNFCSDICYERWLESTKDHDAEPYYGNYETAGLTK